ncbi:MAG: hypothetical protein DMG86_08015 [Acidobacteria bacterium]|nr:MAG: hypothetical protein DMG86_08015 [Acidobacteriota bacterium]
MSLKQSFAIMLLMVATASAQTYNNIPAGTQLQVRIIEKLSSEQASVGDQFHGTFAAPVVVNGRTQFSKGTDVTGEVTSVERSGRLSRPGELHLSLRTVRSGGRTYAIAADPFVIKGESHTKSNVTKIGGGAGLGALIGAIAGGGKGAAIGAGVGAAAGTGVAAGTGKKPAEVESEAVLTWVAANPPSGSVMQGQERRQASRYDDDDDDRPSRSGNRARSNNQDEDNDDQGPREFSSRERQIISDCYVADRSNLPPGLAKKDRLPPGLERQLRRNGTLPPGLQKRVQLLPGVCTARLPRLPRDWARVVLSGRIILLDPANRIVDFFWMDADE